MRYVSITILLSIVLLSSFILVSPIKGDPSGDGDIPLLTVTRSSFAGGKGTLDDPYQISTVQELQNISMNRTEHFVLLNNIDASVTKEWNGGKGFDPIGGPEQEFLGSLDGREFRISNLWIDRGNEFYVGIFSGTNGAWIHHLEVLDATVKGKAVLGILSGYIVNTRMENCTISGDLSGSFYNVGGLTGSSAGAYTKVLNCTSDVDIEVGSTEDLFRIGGGIGYTDAGTIENCASSGDVTITGGPNSRISQIGGLIGYNNAQIRTTSSTGSFSIKDWHEVSEIGGLIGYNTGRIDSSYSEMDIEIEAVSDIINQQTCQSTGGLIGYNQADVLNSHWSGFINIFYSTIKNINIDHSGGLIGQNYGSVASCYSDGLLLLSGYIMYTGGLIGKNSGPVTSSHTSASLSISAQSYGSNIGGLIGAHNSYQITTSHSTGSVDLTVSNGNCDFVGGLIGYQYRGQVTQCYSRSDLTVNGAGDTRYISGLVGYLAQGSVEASNSAGSIIISMGGTRAVLVGGLIGQNDWGTVSNSYSTSTISITGKGDVYYLGGLVGYSNIGMSYIYSTGAIDISAAPASSAGVHSIGGLVGYTSQNVEWCYSAGDIIFDLTGSFANNRFYRIGGLIGENTGGFISRAYSKNDIYKKSGTGNNIDYTPQRVGGLIGYNSGTVRYCYSLGTLSINESRNGEDIGGLVGYNDGSISDCYAVRSFYYTQAPNHNDIGGLVGVNDGGRKASITDCYSVFSINGPGTSEVGGLVGNNIGTMSGCFYDKNVFPYDKAVVRNFTTGSSANTTLEMKKRETFLREDWDFLESWGIIEDRTYPWLYPLYYAPVIKLNKPAYAIEDEDYIVKFEIDHSTYPSINYLKEPQFDSSASWLKMDKQKDILIGTPTNDDVGFYWVNFSVEDYVGEVTNVSFDLEVRNVNDPPQIVTEDITNIMEDEPYSRYYYAIDVDPILTELTWRMETNARWLSFDGNHLHGTPLNYDIGEYWVNVSVYDLEGDFGFTNFTLTVESANDAPVITSVPVTIAIEDKPYSMNLRAEDEDLNDILTWTLESAPPWLLFTRTQIKGTPTNDDVGKTMVRLKVTDLEGAYDELNFLLEVKNVNDEPFWVEFPDDLSIIEGDPVFLSVLAEDIDVEDSLAYNITSDPTSNITIDTRTGTIRWMDTTSGNYTVKVSVTDGYAVIDRDLLIIVKERPPVVDPENHLPEIDIVQDMKAEEGKTLSIQITATDEDGDVLFYDIAEGPFGMVISGSGELVWTPFAGDIGNHAVNISVSDGKGSSFVKFRIEVKAGGAVDDDDTVPDDDDTIVQKEKANLTPYLAVIIVLGLLLLGALIVIFIIARRKQEIPVDGPPEPASGKEATKEEE